MLKPLKSQMRLGGKSDGMAAGNPANLGTTALVEIDSGIRVMVVSRKMQVYDQALLRHVGIEPRDCSIIALKSSVHFRADFGDIAAQVIIASSPGPVVADPRDLPFQYLREDLKRHPG